MAGNEMKKTYTIDVNVGTEKYKQQLKQMANEAGVAVKEISENEVVIRLDQNIKGYDQIKTAIQELGKNASIRLAIDKDNLKKQVANAKEEIKKLTTVNLKGDFTYTKPEPSGQAGSSFKIGATVETLKNQLKYTKELNIEETKYGKELENINQLLEKQGKKNTNDNRKELEAELTQLAAREAALKRINELETKNVTNANGEKVKLYESSVEALNEYRELLDLVIKLEANMSRENASALKGKNTILPDFNLKEVTDVTGKLEAMEQASYSLYQNFEQLQNKLIDMGGADFAIYDQSYVEKLTTLLGTIINQLDKAAKGNQELADAEQNVADAAGTASEKLAEQAEAERQAGEAGKEAGDAATQSMENAGDAAIEAAKQAEEAAKKYDEVRNKLAVERSSKNVNQGLLNTTAQLTSKDKIGKATEASISAPLDSMVKEAQVLTNTLSQLGSNAGLSKLDDTLGVINRDINMITSNLEKINGSKLDDPKIETAKAKYEETISILSSLKTSLEEVRKDWEAAGASAEAAGEKSETASKRMPNKKFKAGGTKESTSTAVTGEGTGEHAGPLYTEEDVKASEVNINKTKEHIITAINEIKENSKFEITYDEEKLNAFIDSLSNVIQALDNVKDKVTNLSPTDSDTGVTQQAQQEATALDNVEQQAVEATEAVKKLIEAETGITGTTVPSMPVDVHLDEDAKFVLSNELNTVITQLNGLQKLLIEVGIEPKSVTQTITDVKNLVYRLKDKGPITFDAKVAEESRRQVKTDLQSIITSVKGADGKGVPIDIELSPSSVKNVEERVTAIAQKVNKAVTDSQTINDKQVNIPVKIASITSIVGKAVKDYNSSEHPSHVIKLQATITKTSLMSKIKDAVTEVNNTIADKVTGGIKVPVKADSNRTLKDAGLKNTEDLLQRIKEEYSNINIKIKLAKDSDIDKINEVFTKIKDALNQVNKSGGIKIVYNTNGSGNNIVQHSADEEKALASLHNELDKLIKSYRDFQNTDSLFADKKTSDTQEAQAIKKNVEELYRTLTTLDTNETGDVNTFTGILNNFESKLAELKLTAKSTYSSMTSDMKEVSKEAENDVQAIENLIQRVESYRADTKVAKTAKLVERDSEGNFAGSYTGDQIEQLKLLEAEYLKLQNVVNKVHEAYMKGGDLTGAAEEYDRVKTSVREMYDAFNKGLKGTSSKSNLKKIIAEDVHSIDEAKAAIIDYNQALANAEFKGPDTKNGVTTLTYALQEQEGILKTLKFQYNEATGAVTEFGSKEQKITSIGERFSAMLKERGMSLVAYLGTFASFYRLIGTLKEGIQVVHEVDTAFTELKKVAQESESQLKSFANTTAFDVAESIGSTGKDIINLTADFERLGYALGDAQRLAKDTGIMMNVGDMENSEEAMQSLVSTMKGFNLTTEDSTKIVDEFNEVGNQFSISTEGIAEAMQRSSASLAQANNSLEQSVALAVAANDVVQDPQQVGNTLKVVALRVRGAKTELEEMGEETDNLAGSTSKLRAELQALTGVDIMEADGKSFKSTYDILLEISKVWDKLSDVSQANVLEKLAGKQRSNAVASILQNAEDLEAAYETAQNATGSAAQENMRYLESIDGKLNQLATTWQKVWVNTFDSDVLKGFVDLANGILKVIDALGGLDNIIAAIGFGLLIANLDKVIGLFSKWKTALESFSGVNIVSLFKDWVTLIKNAATAQKAATAATAASATATEVEAAAQTADAAATTANATAHFALKAAVALVAGAVALAVGAIVKAYKEQKQAQEDARQSSIQTSKDTIASYEEMKSAADKYKSVISNHSHTEEELTNALEGVNSALGDKAETLKALQGDEKAYQEALDKTIEKQKEEARTAALIQKQKASSSIKENLSMLDGSGEALINGYRGSKETIKLIENTMGSYSKTMKNGMGDAAGFAFQFNPKDANDVLTYYDKLIKLNKELNEQSKEYADTAANLMKEADAAEAVGNQALSEELRGQAELYNSYITAIDNYTNSIIEEITRVGDYATEYSDALTNDVKFNYETPTSFAEYEQQLQKFIETETAGKQVTDEMVDSLTTRFAQAFPEFASGVDQVKTAIEDLRQSIPEDPILQSMGVSDSWSEAGMKEYLDSLVVGMEGYITAADLAVVSTETFNNYLSDNNIDIVAGDYEALAKAIIAYKESLQPTIDFQESFTEALNKSKDDIDNFQSSISSLSKVAEGAFDGVTTGTEFVDGLQEVASAMENLNDLDIDLSGIDSIEKLGQVAQQVAEHQLQKLIDKLKEQGASDALISNLKRAASELMTYQATINSAVNGMSSLSSAYQTIRGAMDEYNQTGQMTFSMVSSLLQVEPEYLAMLQMENGQFTINQAALEGLVEEKKADAIAASYAAEQAELDALAEQYSAEQAGNSASAHAALSDTLAIASGSYNAVASAAYNAAAAEAAAAGERARKAGASAKEVKDIQDKWAKYRKNISDIKVDTRKAADSVLGYSSKAAKGAGGAAKDAASTAKQQIDEVLSKLKQAVQDGGLTYKQYLDQARRVTDQAYQQGKISFEEYHNYKMSLLRDEIDMWKQVASAAQFFINEEKEGLQDQLDVIGDQKEALQDQIDSINEYYDGLIKAQEEKIKKYQAKQEKLQKKIKKKEEKQQEVRDKYEPQIEANEKIIKQYEAQIRPLQAIVDQHQAIIDSLNRQIEDIEKVRRVYEYQIDDIEKVQRANNRVINDLEYQQKIYERQQKTIEKAIRVYEREKKLNDRKIKQLEQQQKAYEKQQKALQKQIKDIEKQQKLLEKMKNPYKDQIESLKKQKEELQKVNEERNRALSLQKAQYELDKAQNQRTQYVYTNGGFEYRNDEEKVKSAQDNLEDVKVDIQIADIDDQIDAAQSSIDLITDKIDALQEHIDTLNDKIDELQEPIDAIQEKIDLWNDRNSELEWNIEQLNWKISDLQIPIDTLQDRIDALNNANSEWDYKISQIQIRIDALDDTIEKLNRQIQAQEDIMKPYERQIEDINKQIEKLEEANDLLKEQMEDEIEVIQKQIDAYQKQIDKYDEKIEKINKAIEKLEEERDASVKAIEDQIKGLEKQEKAINKQIKALDKLSKAWDEVAKSIERIKNQELLESVFGPDWQEKIKNGEGVATAIQGITSAYRNLQQESKKSVSDLDASSDAMDKAGGAASNATGPVSGLASALGDTGGSTPAAEKQNVYTDTGGGFGNNYGNPGSKKGFKGSGNGLRSSMQAANEEMSAVQSNAGETDTVVSSTSKNVAQLQSDMESAGKTFTVTKKGADDAAKTASKASNQITTSASTVESGSTAITNAVTGLTAAVQTNFGEINTYAGKAKQIVNTAVLAIESNTRRLKTSERVLTNIVTMSNKVKTEVKKILDETSKQVTQTEKKVSDTLKKLQQNVTKTQQSTKKAIDQVKKLTSLSGGLSPAVKSIKNFISKYLQGSGGIIKKSEEAKKKVTDAFDHNKGLRQAINSIKKFISDYLQKLKSKSDEVRSAIKKHWEGSALENAKSKINSLINSLSNLSSQSKEAKAAVDELANIDASRFNSLISSLDSIIKKVDEVKKKLNELPEKKTVTIDYKNSNNNDNNGKNANGGRVEKYARGGRVKKFNISGALNKIAQTVGEDTMIAVKEGEGIFTKKQTDDLEEFIKLTPELVNASASLSKFAKLFTSLKPNNVNAAFTQNQISSGLALAGADGGMIAAGNMTNSNNFNLSIGDIHLNGVQDVDGLAIDIKNNLPNALLQVLTRR